MKKQLHFIFIVFFLIGVSVFSFGQEMKTVIINGVDPADYAFHDLYLSNDASRFEQPRIGVSSFWHRVTNGNFETLLHNSNNWDDFWNGSGSYYVVVSFIEKETYSLYVYISKNKITFNNTITGVSINDFNLYGVFQ